MMTPELEDRIKGIMQRLDDLQERLDYIIDALIPEEGVCRHERTEDLSTMGMRPRARVRCLDCGEMIRENDNG